MRTILLIRSCPEALAMTRSHSMDTERVALCRVLGLQQKFTVVHFPGHGT